MATNNQTIRQQPAIFRVGGSGFTAFHWMGQVIGFAQSVSVQSPRPVADPVPIQPLDQRYPMQVITPVAIGPGTLQVQLYELYNSKIWDQIMAVTDVKFPGTKGIGSDGSTSVGYPRYSDLSEIFLRLSAIGTGITATKIVYPPNAGVLPGGTSHVKKYADQFYNCAITDIRDDEVITIGTMEVVKNMTMMYTYARRIGETTNNI